MIVGLEVGLHVPSLVGPIVGLAVRLVGCRVGGGFVGGVG